MSITYSRTAAQAQKTRRKMALVHLGCWALARGEWLIVSAIDTVIQRRGMGHV